MNGFSPESSAEPLTNIEKNNRRRAYKACLHCRSRKAKCDLGNIESPSQPPCARCKRESRECVFAPSFRGGKIVRKTEDGGDKAPERRAPKKRLTEHMNVKEDAEPRSVTFSTSDIDLDERRRSGSEGPPRKLMRIDSSGSGSEQVGDHDRDQDRLDPQSLAAASLRNPTDALNLLALAADVDRKNKAKRKEARANGNESSKASPIMTNDISEHGPDSQVDDGTIITCDVFTPSIESVDKKRRHVHRAPSPPPLQEYALIRSKILSPAMLAQLVKLFFARAHAVFPMVPYHRIPQCSVELSQCAAEEPALLTAIVVIVSRQEKMTEAHERSWEYMQTLINELILGKIGSVGTVEALLLLSENLPRRTEPATEDEEHRMAWMLVGMAVRTGYMLGLDQKTLRPLSPGADDGSGDVDEQDEHERIDRERLAWTYCYIFDRSISIRSGKAFWSRGPGLCFQRTHSGTLPSVSEAFPSLRPIKGVQDDFSAMLQAYTELTQIMASAHDVLYPSKDRTIALVRVGDYHKYLDELTRSINGFRLNWEEQSWETTIVSECVWISFHYTRLYIYAFAFQAHVQRSTSTSKDGKKIADNVIFPRGPMGSPDARFILEAIDAATELLHFCVEKLRPSGAVSYLPWRFFLYFQYAGVFLLKAVFVGAVVPQDQRTIVQLVKKVILCLANASSDEQHCGVRYARLLNGLLRVFSRGVDGVTSRFGSPKHSRAIAGLPSETPPTREEREETIVEEILTPTIASVPALETMESAGTAHSVASLQPTSSQTSIPTPPQETSVLTHSPGTEAILAHLPMPRLDASDGLTARVGCEGGGRPLALRHLLAPTSDGFHRDRRPPVQNLNSAGFVNGLTSGPFHYQHGPPRQPQPPSQPLYPAHAHAPPSPANFAGAQPSGDAGVGRPLDVNGNLHYNMYQTTNGAPNAASGAGFSFPPFDLNWPAMEQDGLAQMLADDHALDGDFWMSLPSHAQWQTWPQANTAPAGHGRP